LQFSFSALTPVSRLVFCIQRQHHLVAFIAVYRIIPSATVNFLTLCAINAGGWDFLLSGALKLARIMVTMLLVCGAAPMAIACDQSNCAEDCPNIQCDQASFLPDTGLENPSLAIGLNGISDWSTQHPFFDLMKTARPWIGHLPGQWGGNENSEIAASDILDKDGWPMSLPARAETIEAMILTEQPPAFE
jgi:hypothetical protein